MKNTTIYIRTKGTKTWRKYLSMPTTKEEAEQIKTKIEKNGKSEVELRQAKEGKWQSY